MGRQLSYGLPQPCRFTWKNSLILYTMKNYIALLLILSMGMALKADPPKPPLGKRWVINPHFSDEFNGTQLDNTKWYDHHPKWMGREPGLFLPSQVSVKNGKRHHYPCPWKRYRF